MPQPRYLTKSRYKLAVECPRKLYYTGKRDYANNKSEDSFLMALADSGYQVGELAKQYFPEGVNIDTLNIDDALAQTRELLESGPDVTIFEAAIAHENFLVRVDVLKKSGNQVELIEVKAKSYSADEQMTRKDGLPGSAWAPYLYDVAFQSWVLGRAFPAWNVTPYLMLVDKRASAPTDGLNQKFRIDRDERGRTRVSVAPELVEADLQPSILTQVNVHKAVAAITAMNPGPAGFDAGFEEELALLARAYAEDSPLTTTVAAAKCSACEFYCTAEQARRGDLRDGRTECWRQMTPLGPEPFAEPTVLELWNFRGKDKLMQQGKYRLSQLNEEDIGPLKPPPDGQMGLSQSERRATQLRQAQNPEEGDYLDTAGLRRELQTWHYPLHFIDFETSTEAIPFHRGCRPYEPVIFQISHHVLLEDGTVAHAGEFLEAAPGRYPSFAAVRWLRNQLGGDNGTIFRYSHHENTCLVSVHGMLDRFEDELPDAMELRAFIESITQSTRSSARSWTGERNMVDLCALCLRYYAPVLAKGKTSIKVILPSILEGSEFLQRKYGEPIYGAAIPGGVKSLNFQDQRWVEKVDGVVQDPYQLLPPIFSGLDAETQLLLNVDGDEQINEGSAAMVAYRRLQLTSLNDVERRAQEQALLKYCELDTLAMVMLVEGWLQACSVEEGAPI